MFTPGQLKAARALCGMSQAALATQSDVAKASIQKFEAEKTKLHPDSIEKLRMALNKNHIFFTEDGVRLNANPIILVQGKSHEETYLQLLHDVREQLRDHPAPELLIMYADDRQSPPSVNKLYRELRQHGVKMRQLVEEGNTHLLGPLEEYRYIPKGLFINRVTLVYADRVANETADVLRDVIRIDPINATIQRNTFNILWHTLEQPTESTADERF
ncbi:MAG: helix-turn-helix transcriptional regulator [Candidatus Competibacteraceae bacterium]|nr:helix-turn-helix transcriptional regulator [Candidatus Competibacteraceae bacterium]